MSVYYIFLYGVLTAFVEYIKIVGLLKSGGVPKRSTGADCKSAGDAFVGSNPTPSTNMVRGVGK